MVADFSVDLGTSHQTGHMGGGNDFLFPPISADFKMKWGGTWGGTSPPYEGEILIFPSHNFTRFDASSPHLLGGTVFGHFPLKNTPFGGKIAGFPPIIGGERNFAKVGSPPKSWKFKIMGGNIPTSDFRWGGNRKVGGKSKKWFPPIWLNKSGGAKFCDNLERGIQL